MKKTLITFGIIVMFLLMGFTSVSAAGVKKFERSSNASTVGVDNDLAGLLITHTPVFGEFYYNIAAGIYNFEGAANIKDMKIKVEIIDQDNNIIEDDSYTFITDTTLGPNGGVTHNFLYPFSYKDYRILVTLDFSNRPLDFSNRPDLYDLDSDHDNNYAENDFPESLQKQMLPTPLFHLIQKILNLLPISR